MIINIIFLFFFTFNINSIANKKKFFIFASVSAPIYYFLSKNLIKKIYLNNTSKKKFKEILKNNPYEYDFFYQEILNNLNNDDFLKKFFSEKANKNFDDFYDDASRGIPDKKKINEIKIFLNKYFNFLDKNKFEISNLKIEEIEEKIFLSEKDEKKEAIKKNFISNCFPSYFINNKKIKKDFKIEEDYYKKRIKSIKENKFLFGYFQKDKKNELLDFFNKAILKFAIQEILKNSEQKIVDDVFNFLLSVQKKRNNEYLKEFKKKYGKDFKNNSYDDFYNFFLKRRNLKIFAFSVILFLLRNKIKSLTKDEIKSPIDIFLKNSVSSEKFFENKKGKLILVSIFAGFLISKYNIFSELKIKNLITIVSGTFI